MKLTIVSDVGEKLRTEKYYPFRDGRTPHWVEIVSEEAKQKMILDKLNNTMMEKNERDRKETEKNLLNMMKWDDERREMLENNRKEHKHNFERKVSILENLDNRLETSNKLIENGVVNTLNKETSQRSKITNLVGTIVVGVIVGVILTAITIP
jgi:uncharacterized protein with von Willebrand factor type A (vWA) domain